MGPSEAMVHLLQPALYPGPYPPQPVPCECPDPPLLLEAGSSISVMQEGTVGPGVAAVGTGILIHLSSPWVGWPFGCHLHELLI